MVSFRLHYRTNLYTRSDTDILQKNVVLFVSPEGLLVSIYQLMLSTTTTNTRTSCLKCIAKLLEIINKYFRKYLSFLRLFLIFKYRN